MKKSVLRLENRQLKDHVSYLEAQDKFWESQSEKWRQKTELLEQKIKVLHRENEQMYHTPEFAADTEAALDRGRQDGIRSISQRAQNDMLAMLNDMYVEMEKIAHKYTRDLTMDLFIGSIEAPQGAQSLPDTEFAQKLRAGAITLADM